VVVTLTDEVFKKEVLDVATASVALDHVHLVGRPGVDVAVGDVADVDVGAEGSHGTATTRVAVDVLDEDIFGRALSCCQSCCIIQSRI
jgi:hypothetical protein